MKRKILFVSLFVTLAALALIACVPQTPSPAGLIAVPPTQATMTSKPADTDTPEPQAKAAPAEATATATAAIQTAACTEPIVLEVNANDETVTYQYVRFKAYQDLGLTFTAQECQAGARISSFGQQDLPAHLVIKAASSLPDNPIQPEIDIYPVPGDLQSYSYPLNSLDQLKQVLDGGQEPSSWFYGAALHTGDRFLQSHYNRGVRAFVEYLQDLFIWTNNYLQYSYYGMTDDRRYFINASFPLRVSFLMDIQGIDPLTNTNPQAIPVPDWTTGYDQEKVIEDYNQGIVKRFAESSPGDFTPSYELYDALIQSLQIDVQQPVTSTAQAACFPAPEGVFPFTFTPDSRSLLLRENSAIQILNLDTKTATTLQAPQNIMSAALSPDGKTLAWALLNNTIQLVRLSDQQVLHTLSGHTNLIAKLLFTPDGSQLVSAAQDTFVKVWDMDGKELRSFQPPGQVQGIGISPDGRILATVPYDGPVALWDLDTFEKIKDLGGYGGFTTSDAVFSMDGQYVAADLASALDLWRVSDGKLVWDAIHNSMAVTYSPDGRYLAYSDIDDNSKVFLSPVDGSKIERVMAGPNIVGSLFFSPDSQLLAASGGTETRIWNVADGSLLYIGKTACR